MTAPPPTPPPDARHAPTETRRKSTMSLPSRGNRALCAIVSTISVKLALPSYTLMLGENRLLLFTYITTKDGISDTDRDGWGLAEGAAKPFLLPSPPHVRNPRQEQAL